jgi:hypothetical protein
VCSKARRDACPQGRAFADKARSLGGVADVHAVDLNHGAINGELGKDAAYTAVVFGFFVVLAQIIA